MKQDLNKRHKILTDLKCSIKQLEEIGYPMTLSDGIKRMAKTEIIMVKTLIYVVENLTTERGKG